MSKIILAKIILITILTMISFTQSKKSIKILAVGNSIGLDTFNYVPFLDIVKKSLDLTIGLIYRGGWSIDDHLANLRNSPYEYYKAIPESTQYTKRLNTSLLYALKDEEWDYITFQQFSEDIEIYPTYKNLTKLKNFCKSMTIGNPTFGFNMIPVRPATYKKKDPEKLKYHFNIYVDVIKTVVEDHSMQFIIPSAAGMANAILTGVQLKDAHGKNTTFDTDGKHMRNGVPRLIEAYCAAGTLLKLVGVTDVKIADDRTIITPDSFKQWGILYERKFAGPVDEKNQEIARRAAQMALDHNYEISNITSNLNLLEE